jgi:hypothetical protein
VLKYYTDEEARWGYLQGIEADEIQVVRAIARWANRYFPPRAGKRSRVRFRVQFRAAASTWSWAEPNDIVLTYPVTWLLVCHEFAHLIQWRKRYRRRVWHDDFHRKLVDELCRDVIIQGFDLEREAT